MCLFREIDASNVWWKIVFPFLKLKRALWYLRHKGQCWLPPPPYPVHVTDCCVVCCMLYVVCCIAAQLTFPPLAYVLWLRKYKVYTPRLLSPGIWLATSPHFCNKNKTVESVSIWSKMTFQLVWSQYSCAYIIVCGSERGHLLLQELKPLSLFEW